jgi:hypothetical protein
LGQDHARSLNQSTSLLLLGIASAAFDVGCVLIKTPFLRSGVTAGDAIEAIGVFVVLALFARVGRLAGPDLPRSGGAPRAGVLLGIAATAFAFGHGIHVAGNSIHDLADRSSLGDPTGLMSFWDENVGHYLVDSGRALFAIALTSISWGASSGSARGSAAALAGGIPFGFTVFASAVEGQTVPLVLPFTALYAGWSILARDPFRRGGAVRTFFTAAAWTSLLFFVIWGVWQRGFPEFTRAGIVHSAH